MGSSSSTVQRAAVPNSAVGVRTFPSNSSIKSMSSFGVSYAADEINSMVKFHENEIRALNERNADFEKKLQTLQKTVNELTVQLSVIAVSSPQPVGMKPGKPRVPSRPIIVTTDDGERNLPLIGDKVVAMWEKTKWQYFTATIESFNKKTLQYTIEWDDHDPTGRRIDYYNLARDIVPSADEIGVGSKVLFHQGRYKPSTVHGVDRSGGLRWHQGEIKRVYKDASGNTFYDGHHTKGEKDGKWVTYKDYNESFTGYTIESFRMPPNVFDILSDTSLNEPSSSSEEVEDAERYDVFVSYAKTNCPSAIISKEISGDPPSYDESMLQSICDPRDIVASLTAMGVRVFAKEDDSENSLLEIVSAMNKVKVFIACLSDEYASNDRCRMEFQYAKKTLRLPVIPLVVGSGSFQWKMTVVGLLIAGELYIHFKDKDVQDLKMTELARAIQNNLPDLEIKNVQHAVSGAARLPLYSQPGVTVTGDPVTPGKADFFFSYCWLNSKDAVAKKQIQECVGSEWSDPRLVVARLSSATNLLSWLDIERLESAADGLGMFGQIATAMNNCKVVIACVSDEYANSDNCRMEFQFGVKSLEKPAIAVVVGKGSAWIDSVVGKLVEEGLPCINLQQVTNSDQLDAKIKEISENMRTFVDEDKPIESYEENHVPSKDGLAFRAPVPGDHVICLHQRWAYFKATVETFDQASLNYTVAWDDGDSTGRVQSYKDLALDTVPTEQIGVGSLVLFAQGSYEGTQGSNTGGARYHQGKITKVYTEDNITKFDGEHTKDGGDGKRIAYKEYSKTFVGKTREDLRLPPNAMDALMACKRAYSISEK